MDHHTKIRGLETGPFVDVPKTTGERVSDSPPMAGSVHYRLEGLEAKSDFWRGISTWSETDEDPLKEKGDYEEVNEAENLGWRGFRIVKRTIEAMEPND